MVVVSRLPGYVLGFHGTRAGIAHSVVLGERKLAASTNDYDWLGKGIYFWEGSEQRAQEWAVEQHPEEPAVLGAVVSLGHCLDLLEQRCLNHVLDTYRLLEERLQAAGKALPENKGKRRELDCAVLNAAVRHPPEGLPPYDSVRAAFHEGELLAESSGIHVRSHIQIAVHNPNCIKGYFLPPDVDLSQPGV